MKALRWSLGILLLVPAMSMPARAQQAAVPSSATSPADATANNDAKPKKARVWDNDNIPRAGDEISVVGPAQPVTVASADANASASGAAGNAAAPVAGAAGAAGAVPANNSDDSRGGRKTDKDARLEAAKQKLDSLKKDVDLALRQFSLDSDSYYGKPDYATDHDGAEALKTEKDALTAKQEEVEAAQKELDQLQAELDSSK